MINFQAAISMSFVFDSLLRSQRDPVSLFTTTFPFHPFLSFQGIQALGGNHAKRPYEMLQDVFISR